MSGPIGGNGEGLLHHLLTVVRVRDLPMIASIAGYYLPLPNQEKQFKNADGS